MKLFWVFTVLAFLASSTLVSTVLEETPSSVRTVFTIQNEDSGGHFELRIFGDTNTAQVSSSESYFYVPVNDVYTGYYRVSSTQQARIYVQILKNSKIVFFKSYSFTPQSNLHIKDTVFQEGSNYRINFVISNTGSKPGVVNFLDSDRIIMPGETRTFSKVYIPKELDAQGAYSIIVDGTLLKKKVTNSTTGFFLAGDNNFYYALAVLVLILFLIIFFSVRPHEQLKENEISEKLNEQEVLPEFKQNVI